MGLTLFLCIIVNAYVVIVFKVFDRFKVDLLPAIVINYFVCVITGFLLFDIPSPVYKILNYDWFYYAVFLGLIFISVFNLVGKTVKHFGVMYSTIFQKMSLIGPALVGMWLYAESITPGKIIGILCAILAIILISHPDRKVTWQGTLLLLPLATFFGSAILEITLFYVNIEKIAANADPVFVVAIFLFAGIFGSLVLLASFPSNKRKLRWKEWLGGIGLGIPNFFSIYLVLLLLDGGWEGSSLFPILNVGILFLTGIAGIYFFKESIDKYKLTGFAAAIISIILISLF